MKSFFKKNIKSKISEQKQEDNLVFMWISAGVIEPPINFDTLFGDTEEDRKMYAEMLEILRKKIDKKMKEEDN